MTGFLILAALAIAASSAQSAAGAERKAPAVLASLGGAADHAPVQPQLGSADTVPATCPYHFDSDMPEGTFCVYRGVALGRDGDMCASDVVIIWSSFAALAPDTARAAKKTSASTREVYLAFVADPNLVVRAIVDPRQADSAEMAGYTLSSGKPTQPLAGKIILRAVALGAADVLSIDLREPRRFHPGDCAFASYSGTYVGVIAPASAATTAAVPHPAPH